MDANFSSQFRKKYLFKWVEWVGDLIFTVLMICSKERWIKVSCMWVSFSLHLNSISQLLVHFWFLWELSSILCSISSLNCISFAVWHRFCHTKCCLLLFLALGRGQIRYHMWWCLRDGWMFMQRRGRRSINKSLAQFTVFVAISFYLCWSVCLFIFSPRITQTEKNM